MSRLRCPDQLGEANSLQDREDWEQLAIAAGRVAVPSNEARRKQAEDDLAYLVFAIRFYAAEAFHLCLQ